MRNLCILMWFCCACRIGIAQDNQFKKVMPGFDIGINNGQQQMRSSDQVATMRNGLRAGITLEKPATRRLTLLSALSFVQSGGIDVRFSNDDERLNYAELSFRAVEYVPVGGSDLFVSLGPYFSYGLNGNVVNANGETIVDNPFKLATYQRFEWGLGGNIGFKAPWGTYLQVGMQSAFSNFYEMQGNKYFNYSLMFTAGQTIQWRNFKSYRKAI